MLHLRYVLDGEDRSYTLAGDRVRLGRGSDNDVVLSDVSVSRYHAEILLDPEGWTVHDLKSTHGVEGNGAPAEKAPLHPGDHLSIGSFEIRVEEEPPLTVRPQPVAADAGLGHATALRPPSAPARAL